MLMSHAFSNKSYRNKKGNIKNWRLKYTDNIGNKPQNEVKQNKKQKIPRVNHSKVQMTFTIENKLYTIRSSLGVGFTSVI